MTVNHNEQQRPAVAIFCMPEPGHFQALQAVIGRVASSRLVACVFTHDRFRQQVESLGARFVDLFAKYPLDLADGSSQPIPCRYVSFAGTYGERVASELRTSRFVLVIYETFSVIGPIVARQLGIPCVNVCVNHNPHPERTLRALGCDKRVNVSTQCLGAVDRLREQFGLADASPFSYVTALSPLLNLYGEPPEFLDQADQAAFAPLAYFGCLPDPKSPDLCSGSDRYFAPDPAEPLKVYVSFGTIIWRYYAAEALAALQAIASASEQCGNMRVVISLGDAQLQPEAIAALERPRVRVLPFVDQGQILTEADLFVTHHGLNSTHEAIVHRVPMLSYPFLADQPALAAKCQQLGLAIPLTHVVRGPIKPRDVQVAISQYRDTLPAMQSRLAAAAAWEQRTMDGRPAVMQRIMDLIGSR